MNKKSVRKTLFTIGKILLSIALLTWVLQAMDFSQLQEKLIHTNWFYLMLAFISFVASQLFSVKRLECFLRTIEIPISYNDNTKLYALGMFYNFFVPGGVGGDAYKVYALKKTYNNPLSTIAQAVFLDRLIGLGAICVLICLGLIFVDLPIHPILHWGIFAFGIIGIFIGPIILGRIFKAFNLVFRKTLAYSILIQLLQTGCVVFCLWGVESQENTMIYVLMFFVSSVLSILSFAGIGVREFTFYKAAEWLDFDPNTAAGIALLFSVITLLVSLIGIKYMITGLNLKQPKTKNE